MNTVYSYRMGLFLEKEFGLSYRKYCYVIAYLLSGFIFVCLGGWIAPSHKIFVVIVQTVVKIIDALGVKARWEWTVSTAVWNFISTFAAAITF